MNFNVLQNFDYYNNTLFTEYIPTNKIFTNEEEIHIFEAIKRIDIYLNYYILQANSLSVENFKKSIADDIQIINNILNSKKDRDLELITKQLTNMAIELSVKHILSKVNKINVDNNFDSRLPSLKKDGFYTFTIPETTEFHSLCDELMISHRKMYEKQDDWRGANAFEGGIQKDKFFLFFEKFILDNKIDELISKYHGAKCRIKYIASDYCHSRQTWFRNNHEGQDIIKTNYIHFDADPNVSKMLIYLSDVTDNDGPFKFVRGSNLQQISLFLKYMHYSLEQINNPIFSRKDDLYVRGLFTNRKDLLMKLPNILIGATHFGDDLLEGSVLYNYVVDNLVSFEASKGTCILFDGFSGLHVGGNPLHGERLAIQVAFEYEVKKVYNPIRRLWFQK